MEMYNIKLTNKNMKRILTLCMLSLVMMGLHAQNEEELWIKNGARNIYGVLSRPDNANKKHPVAIIAHGFNGSHAFGKGYFKTLNDLGYMCYTFDFPCGSVNSRSDNNTMNMSVFDEQRDLEAIVRYFRSQPDVDTANVVLIGESQGGLVSALTAADIPSEVSRLILCYPALCIPDNWNSRYNVLADIPDTTRLWNVPMGHRFFEEVHYLKPFDVIDRYKGPVLIIQGDKDRIVSMDDSRRAVAMYREARLHVIKGAGHGFRGTEQQEALEQIRDFLK